MPPLLLLLSVLTNGFRSPTVFTRDILTNPATREATDVAHKLVAVASSKDAQRAAEFIKKVDGPAEAKAYGSYAELVNDPNVDIIYVATPHSHHFQNTMLALHAGKHVLCEKAMTVTADQTRRLVETAREKKLFLMEAVWTRHQPLSKKVRELVAGGEIGPVSRVFADISFNNLASDGSGKLHYDDASRSVNLDLAGGALLDLGVYALTWVFQVLYHIQPEAEKEKPEVVAGINKYHTGSDDSTAIILRFPKHNTLAVATTSMRTSTDPSDKGLMPSVRIQGAKGEIQVANPSFRPDDYRIIRKDGGGEVETVKFSHPGDPARGGWGQGFYWQADEAARCIRDGKLESPVMPLDESIAIMEVVDAAFRQGGITYPDHITSTDYDPQHPLNTGKA